MIRLLVISILILSVFACSEEPQPGKQIFVPTGKTVIDGYWVYLPQSYDPQKAYPLILFLQGGAGVSNDIRSTKNDGPAKFALQDIPIVKDSFIIINPHMRVGDPAKNRWSNYGASIKAFIEGFNQTYPIDSSRIYLTGLSYGAGEGMSLLNKRQFEFKGFVGVAGRYQSKYKSPNNIRKTDIWLLHRKDDPQVPSRLSSELMEWLYPKKDYQTNERIDSSNSSQILTMLQGNQHTGWNETFSNPAIYQWLLSRK